MNFNRLTWSFLLFAIGMALASDKSRITIEVVDSAKSQREFHYVIPGTPTTSSTDCNVYSTAVNCQTTTTPGRPAAAGTNYINQVHVQAIMPEGKHVTLWCQNGFRKCSSLSPGSYQATVDGNSLWIYGHQLDGKEVKNKYRYVGSW